MPIGPSLVAAVISYLMYQLFYGSRYIGAGVHRTFIIGGPAITTLFLGIQTSIPLSLGLLGGLSFVRFRTPVKDPAEIGFLLLVIASSIGAAAANYVVTMLLFVVVFISLGVQWMTGNKVSLYGRGSLIVSVDRESFPSVGESLTSFLGERLSGLTLETMSTIDDRVGLHYQFRRESGFDWPAFATELDRVVGPAKVDISVG